MAESRQLKKGATLSCFHVFWVSTFSSRQINRHNKYLRIKSRRRGKDPIETGIALKGKLEIKQGH